MEWRAANVGTLPPAGRPLEFAGMRLLGGRHVAPDPAFTAGGTGPVMWMSRRPEPDAHALWRGLAAHFADSGLWPLLLEVLDGDGERPWASGELDPAAASDPASRRVPELLSGLWSEASPVNDAGWKLLAPFGAAFPGTAAESAVPEDPAAVAEALAALAPDVAVGLVPVQRPADALATIGWQGAVNAIEDAGVLSAVLRSWEDRFGAFLVGVGFDTVTLAVTRPVRPMRIARVLAAEQFALCPDCVWQGAGSLERLAEALQHARVWMLWWD